jgi:hypothetical protein
MTQKKRGDVRDGRGKVRFKSARGAATKASPKKDKRPAVKGGGK